MTPRDSTRIATIVNAAPPLGADQIAILRRLLAAGTATPRDASRDLARAA
ncbi:MAG TPA: hypothetical protein VHA75_08055 [Rugosimonospora sp.]|nr:hypothetical protein [Rugosimonospora sp.]